MSAPSIRRLGALLAVSVAATAIGTTAAVAAPGTGPAPGRPPTNHQGTLPDGATWTIDVPAHWNGTLLLFSHGLVAPGDPNPAVDATDPLTAGRLLTEGFALAGSSFASTGWAVEDALRDQRDLLDVVTATIGAPKRTVAWGPSLGGMVSTALVEESPTRFAGALSLCGVLGGSVGLLNGYLDMLFAARSLLAADAPIDLVHLTDPSPSIGALAQALDAAQATPEGRARIALAAALGDLPTVTNADQTFPTDPAAQEQAQYEILRNLTLFIGLAERADVEQRAGGNPSWNTGVDYRALLQRSADRHEVKALYAEAGLDLGTDVAALASAPRISADPAAVKYATKFTTFTGQLQDPVLTIHTIGDPFVPVQHEEAYARAAAAAGTSTLLRQAFTARGGHCTFTPAETVAALHALLSRIDHGTWQQHATAPALNAAAAALGPDLNVHFDDNSGTIVPTPSAYATFDPTPFLRPFDRAAR
jgi:hypothetical protein